MWFLFDPKELSCVCRTQGAVLSNLATHLISLGNYSAKFANISGQMIWRRSRLLDLEHRRDQYRGDDRGSSQSSPEWQSSFSSALSSWYFSNLTYAGATSKGRERPLGWTCHLASRVRVDDTEAISTARLFYNWLRYEEISEGILDVDILLMGFSGLRRS